jgi:predicted acylesterase/phospholipase RssA
MSDYIKKNIIINQERVLVISGGGARGAWGGGLIKAIYDHEKPDYRCIVGNSTGSLLAPLVAIDDYELMKECFTNISMEDIFDVNPFREDGDINGWKAAWRVIFGRENLGETNNLKRIILDRFGPDRYKLLQQSGRTIKATVVNLSSNEVSYQSSANNNYEDMVDWIWASANQPVFMTAVDKLDKKWVDGGIKENVPIVEGLKYAVENELDYIDVVVNNQEGIKTAPWPTGKSKTNVIPKLLRIIDIFSDEVRLNDIEIGILQAKVEKKNIYVYFMSKEEYNLCPKSLLFKKDVLKELWRRGNAHKLQKELTPDIVLPGDNRIYIR